ncbi:MAG: PorV/PorQ family protein [bacterium]
MSGESGSERKEFHITGVFCPGAFHCVSFLAAACVVYIVSVVSFAGEPGSSGASFLKIGGGPRAEAMGEAHSAVADDSYSAYWNPAGLGQIEYAEASFAFNRYFQDVNQQSINYVKPLASGRHAIAFSMVRLSVESFPSYNAYGAKVGETDASDWSVAFAYGKQFPMGRKSSVGAGLSMKGIFENLGHVSASTFAMDGGLFYRVSRFAPKRPGDGFRLALAFQNLGPGLRFDSETARLPLTVRAGTAYETKILGDKFTLALDRTIPNDHKAYTSLGAEYWLRGMFALRSGFKFGQDEGSGFRAGMGIRVKSVDFNYSFSPFGSLGNAHRIGMAMRFGAPVEITPLEPGNAEEFLERGRLFMEEGRYYEAILDFNRAMEKDRGNRKALVLMKQAYEKLKKQ